MLEGLPAAWGFCSETIARGIRALLECRDALGWCAQWERGETATRRWLKSPPPRSGSIDFDDLHHTSVLMAEDVAVDDVEPDELLEVRANRDIARAAVRSLFR